jgi:hypothetical protein
VRGEKRAKVERPVLTSVQLPKAVSDPLLSQLFSYFLNCKSYEYIRLIKKYSKEILP